MSSTPSKHDATVLVVGSLNTDFIGIVKKHTARRYHQSFKNEFERPGGHGANQAVAVYRASYCRPEPRNYTPDRHMRSASGPLAPIDIIDFDIHVEILGMVGEDNNRGDAIQKELKDNGVNVDGIGIAKGVQTGYAHVHVNGEGVPLISNSEGANRHLTPNMIKSWFPVPDMVLVQLEIPVDTVRKVIEQAISQTIPIVFNPAPYDENHNLREDKKLFKVDHLIVNAICADQILDLPEISEQEFLEYERRSEMQKRYIDACNMFHNLGAGVQRQKGLRNQKIWIFGAKQGPNPLVDETGAGDTFIGMYAVEILRQIRSGSETLDIGAAIELGIRAGGLAVAKLGSMDSIPWRDELFAPERSFTSASPFEFDEDV